MVGLKNILGRSFLIVGLAMILMALVSQSHPISSNKLLEQYWNESGVTEKHLFEFLNDEKCYKNEKVFLACANIISSMAFQMGYVIDLDHGSLNHGSLNQVENQTENHTEKKLLAMWSDKFNAPAKISFVAYWNALKAKIPQAKRAHMIGIGISAYYSIMRDPHTYILPAKYYQQVLAVAENRSSQLGLSLVQQGNQFFIKKVMEGSPAQLSQVARGDQLLKVNDRPTKGLSLPQINEILRFGSLGETTSISIQRSKEVLQKDLVRREFSTPSIVAKFIDGIKPFGLLTINKFAHKTCDLVREELDRLVAKNIKGLVIDLRDNPGGQVDEAACVGSLFLGSKKLFELQYLSPDHPAEEIYGDQEIAYEGPLAILINGGTASAAEILAGSLQDYQRAILVGSRTFGKGSFQEGDFWILNGSVLLFETKGIFFLPSGRSPQLAGLEPNVNVTPNFAHETEVDLYAHPLKPIYKKLPTVMKVAKLDDIDCSTFQSRLIVNTDDDIKQAQRVLFCRSMRLGVK